MESKEILPESEKKEDSVAISERQLLMESVSSVRRSILERNK